MVGKTKVKGYVSSEEVSESEKCESARGDLLKVYLANARANSVGDEPGLRGGDCPRERPCVNSLGRRHTSLTISQAAGTATTVGWIMRQLLEMFEHSQIKMADAVKGANVFSVARAGAGKAGKPYLGSNNGVEVSQGINTSSIREKRKQEAGSSRRSVTPIILL